MRSRLARLIYVDDDVNLRELARVVLSQDVDLTVCTASSGPEAVGQALRDRPDLILLDVGMPDVDGPATLVLLRSHPELTSVPVVFVTARAMEQEVKWLRSLGVADVISKPFDPRTLLSQVREIWASNGAG